MGFGHRVYKNYDPRAKIMQKTCHEVLSELGVNDPLLDVAMELEQIALHDEYFIEKKLYPNVDFYSGITLRAMGFPTTMFTVLFALARTVGWIAQWKEMIEDPHQKIGRPRQLYTGSPRARLSADLAAEVTHARRACGEAAITAAQAGLGAKDLGLLLDAALRLSAASAPVRMSTVRNSFRRPQARLSGPPRMLAKPNRRKLRGASGPVATSRDADGRDRYSPWVFGTVGEHGPSVLRLLSSTDDREHVPHARQGSVRTRDQGSV